ncbi:MAG TPA: protein kinase, partial [Naasia sp.]
MADVYLGTDIRLGRTVAIKLLKSSLTGDPAFRSRFRQEAQAAARMAHPTIVRVFDAGEEIVRDANGVESPVPFIIMEYVDGKLLKDIIGMGPLEPAEAVHIVDGILTALEYSHRAGVVHRDIKPGNIMITRTGQVKVMDFGIARAVSDSSATVAQTTAILGTAAYFSPEQARGESVDARTDLYSTGLVLFEMLTGRQPFRGNSAV